MLKSFHLENKDPAFVWQEVYGGGFDVMNFSVLNRPSGGKAGDAAGVMKELESDVERVASDDRLNRP